MIRLVQPRQHGNEVRWAKLKRRSHYCFTGASGSRLLGQNRCAVEESLTPPVINEARLTKGVKVGVRKRKGRGEKKKAQTVLKDPPLVIETCRGGWTDS